MRDRFASITNMSWAMTMRCARTSKKIWRRCGSGLERFDYETVRNSHAGALLFITASRHRPGNDTPAVAGRFRPALQRARFVELDQCECRAGNFLGARRHHRLDGHSYRRDAHETHV